MLWLSFIVTQVSEQYSKKKRSQCSILFTCQNYVCCLLLCVIVFLAYQPMRYQSVCPFSFCDFSRHHCLFDRIFCDFCEFLFMLKAQKPCREREFQLHMSYFLCRSSALGFVLFCFFLYKAVIFPVKNSLNFLHLHQLGGKISVYFSENFKI